MRDQIDADANSLWWEVRPKAFRDSTTSLRNEGRFVAVADLIRADFSNRAVSSAMPDVDRTRALRQIDAVRAELQRGVLPLAREYVGRNEGLEAFVVFAATADSVVIREERPQTQRRALCWAALELADLTTAFALPQRMQFLGFLKARVERWENFQSRGYVMFPFEALLNSWVSLGRPALEPPTRQLVFLHPSVSMQVDLPLTETIKGRDALLLEPLGILFYNGDRDAYWGVTSAVGFANDTRPAFGGVLHLSRYGHAGYAYRAKSDAGDAQHVITISADLFRSLSRLPETWQKEREAARAKAEACLRSAVQCIVTSVRP